MHEINPILTSLQELSKTGFSSTPELQHYKEAAELGLWDSEKVLVKTFFTDKDAPTLLIGCGAGRDIVGMGTEGFTSVVGIDYVESMAIAAQEIANKAGIDTSVMCMDARNIGFPDESFQNVTFFFNGLMMIPGSEQ